MLCVKSDHVGTFSRVIEGEKDTRVGERERVLEVCERVHA